MAEKLDDQIKMLCKAMEEVQSGKRYRHTLGVAYTAASLAMRYGSSIKEAMVAGLLHDCAKCLTDEKQLKICDKNGLSVSAVERRNPYLLHGKVGAFLAKTKYEIEDQQILDAIEWHTTGRPQMAELEKIIFIADYIEPGRTTAPNLAVIRKMAFEDLDQALIKILEDTLQYLKDGKGEIDPMTKKTYEYYLSVAKER